MAKRKPRPRVIAVGDFKYRYNWMLIYGAQIVSVRSAESYASPQAAVRAGRRICRIAGGGK